METNHVYIRRKSDMEFPDSLVVTTPCFCCKGAGSIPAWGTKNPQAMRGCQKITKEKRMRRTVVVKH